MFTVSVETTGGLAPEELVKEAIQILVSKLVVVRDEIEQVGAVQAEE